MAVTVYTDVTDGDGNVIQSGAGRRRAHVREHVESGLNDSALDDLIDVASAIVDRRASAAPSSVCDQAMIRMVGWLNDRSNPALGSETVGDYSSEMNTAHVSAWHYSGAASLLKPWIPRGLGVVE